MVCGRKGVVCAFEDQHSYTVAFFLAASSGRLLGGGLAGSEPAWRQASWRQASWRQAVAARLLGGGLLRRLLLLCRDLKRERLWSLKIR
jgi:hypothetical protein